jgi:CO/xanthine dehydrogenase Mo-binding subunit
LWQSRVVTVIDAGRIINPLAGRNQIEGAVVMGVRMALFEQTAYDPQNGAPINASLADYIVAVNADAPQIDVHFLDYPDKQLNEVGARGIGEIGLAGIAAAITSRCSPCDGRTCARAARANRGLVDVKRCGRVAEQMPLILDRTL